MAQKHMDRLTAVDATFLHQESAATHMHIGGVVVLEGPAPAYGELCDHIASRLPRVPRYRQRLANAPYQTGRPLWIDDGRFDIEYHVRHGALPRPGGEEQLLQLTARVFSQQLDRARPLWELWLIEGLQDGRFAIISKTHHALVDGVSGAELLTALFDLTPDYVPAGAPQEMWVPEAEPSTLDLLSLGVRDAAGLVGGTAVRLMAGLSRPSQLIGQARAALQGVGEVAWAGLKAAPQTPFNVAVGPHRRFTVVRAPLSDFKLVKNAFGGTVNDVVLCVVAGALGRFLRGRGVDTEGVELRACVPVSTRGEGQRGTMGNQITLLLAPLTVGINDPVARLGEVRRAMDGIKSSKQALGANVIVGLQAFAPPTILAQASRIGMSSRMYNLLVTNVPGPQFAVYALGRRLLEISPVAFLAPDHALAVGVMSYDGGVNFGLLADYDALPDLEVLAAEVKEALAELVGAARAAADGAGSAAAAPVRRRRAGADGDRVGGASMAATPRAAGRRSGRRRSAAGTKKPSAAGQ